ncbi:ribonuclease H-like domain-containing protein, partial [Mycena epipterygia]
QIACAAVKSVRGSKEPWITHLLGPKGKPGCPHASTEAKAAATAQREEMQVVKKRVRTDDAPDVTEPPPKKQQHVQSTLTAGSFRRNDMPFSPSESDALQAQALRAVVSAGLAFRAFEDPEMQILFGMMRSTAPQIMPTAKVLSTRLLDAAAADLELRTGKILKNKNIACDVGLNIYIQSYLLELIEVTALNKDGPSLCEQFAEMIDRIEVKHDCVIIYFTTDADGGSKKGRILLGLKRPWLILPSCWAHQFQLILGDYFKVNDAAALIAEDATALIGWINNHGKVRKIFDESQGIISKDRAGRIIIVAYLVANITRWTTHFVAFCRIFALRQSLQLAVLQKRSAIIAAEVGAATSTEAARLTEDAERFCALIEDQTFSNGLETVLGDLEPICLGTNINQKDSTRLDQVLLTIAGIFLSFSDHPEPEVRKKMLIRLEKRWKDCDQPVFLLALILNPFKKLSCFGPNADLNQFKCLNILISARLCTFMRLFMLTHPDNEDTAAERKVKEDEVTKAFMQYMSGSGDFIDFDAGQWEEMFVCIISSLDNTDPIQVWRALVGTRELAELAKFAIIILQIVANQAGCERTFSKTKIEQSDHRNRLGLGKLEKRTKVRLYKPRKARKNHKSTANLLSVPRYRDLLDDQDDEDPSERGRALISSPEGWRTEMAKGIGDARAAQRADEEVDAEDNTNETSAPPPQKSAWKSLTLQKLFGGAEKPRTRKPSARAMEEEILMEALAEAAEDENLDDGAIEIESDEEYQG